MNLDFLPKIEPVYCFMAVPVAAIIGVGWPICGAVIRQRASYVPIRQSSGRESRSIGTWEMLCRVKRIEGWAGLYKGFGSLIAFISPFLIPPLVGLSPITDLIDAQGVSSPLRLITSTVWQTLISVPMTIILDRSIITPSRLSTNPIKAVRSLLSKHEFSHPFSLYSNVGLLTVNLLLNIPGKHLVKHYQLPVLFTPSSLHTLTPGQWAILIMWQLSRIAVLTPLDVIMTRLSVQPNLGPEDRSEKAYAGDAHIAEDTDLLGGGQGVVAIRSISEPYTGILDCATKMIREEGYKSLYVGWQLELFGGILASIS